MKRLNLLEVGICALILCSCREQTSTSVPVYTDDQLRATDVRLSDATPVPILQPTPTPEDIRNPGNCRMTDDALVEIFFDTTPITGQNLYLWSPVLEPATFLVISPDLQFPNNQIVPPQEASDIEYPKDAIAAIFPVNGNYLAYLTVNKSTKLWISSLDLQRPMCIWEDAFNWLGEIFLPEDVRIRWGANQSQIILSNNTGNDHYVLLDLTAHSYWRGSGECNRIQATDDLRVLCVDKLNSAFGISSRGIELITSGDNSESMEALEWAFSPSGESLLLVDGNLDILIINGSQDILKLPIKFDAPLCCGLESHRDGLQWLPDEEKVLVFGYRDDEPSQWYIINVQSMEVLWEQPISKIMQSLGFTGDTFYIQYDASISFDENWFVSTYSSGAFHLLAITSIQTDETEIIGEIIGFDIAWGQD